MSSLANESVVLLVEDNPTDELLTVRALKKNNFPSRIVVARDGQEALDYMFASGKYADRDIGDLPHFILLDLKLPKVDGHQVLAKIREDDRTAIVPIIILTSSKEERDLVESYRKGANSYIQKPVDFTKFTEVAQQLGIYWTALNELPRSIRP